MERLTHRLNNNKIVAIKGSGCNWSANSFDCQISEGRKRLGVALEKLAEYEDLEEQGLLVRLPVAIGTKVYIISSFLDCIYNYDNCKVTQKWKCEEDIPCEYEKKLYCVKEIEFYLTLKDAIGKTIFLTREEAEKKLEELENE